MFARCSQRIALRIIEPHVPIESMVVWHQLYFWNTRTPKWGKRWKTANGVDGYCRHIALTWFELEQCRHWNNCRNWSTSYRKVWEGRNVLRIIKDLLDNLVLVRMSGVKRGELKSMSSSRSSRLKTLSDKQFYIKLLKTNTFHKIKWGVPRKS